jgi:hypothetical protein
MRFQAVLGLIEYLHDMMDIPVRDGLKAEDAVVCSVPIIRRY